MVAITVAISATVYVYASGLVGTSGSITPVVSFTKNPGRLTCVKGDLTYNWSNVNVSFKNTSTPFAVTYPAKPVGMMRPGDVIQINTAWSGVMSIAAGDHLIGTWNFP